MMLLEIEGTTTTPNIVCDPEKGRVYMAGDSYPENSFEFFNALLKWIEDYLTEEEKPLELELRLVYLNTSSVKVMMDIFDMLEDTYLRGRKISLTWFYDNRNERVMDLAEEFKEDCTFPFFITADN